MFQARQGDLFFEEVKALPQNVRKKNDPVLAYGEVTGHLHKIENAGGVCFFEDDEASYFKGSNEDPRIVHDEHGTIAAPADKWIKVTRQREYDPLAANRERKVKD